MKAYLSGSLIFVAVLICTVGLKVFVLLREPDNGLRTIADVRAALSSHRFSLEPDVDVAEPPYVSGHIGKCSLDVYLVSPHGWHRDLLRQLAGPGDASAFMYDKARDQDQPVWTTWLHYDWWRVNELLGRRLPYEPVFGVLWSSACGKDDIPWSALADLTEPTSASEVR
jgi:hypothetical protein